MPHRQFCVCRCILVNHNTVDMRCFAERHWLAKGFVQVNLEHNIKRFIRGEIKRKSRLVGDTYMPGERV